LQARVIPYRLKFKFPAGTSRGVLHEKETYFLVLTDGERTGIGECAVFRGLSYDDRPEYADFLSGLADQIQHGQFPSAQTLTEWPSIRFGWETALRSLENSRPDILFPSDFTEGKEGILINGLIWMGDKDFMLRQIDRKLQDGYRTIKIKIGGLDFDTELDILRYIRQHHDEKTLEIRTDANGAFTPDDALEKLHRLAEFDIHSIEQPIRAGQWDEMAALCESSPVPIALDEELIPVQDVAEKRRLLQHIRPPYIILKPSLTGGFSGTQEWMNAADETGTKYWITSALESNVGLNAIAQFTYLQRPTIPQGLGTGGLFTNNIPAPVYLKKDRLYFDPSRRLEFPV